MIPSTPPTPLPFNCDLSPISGGVHTSSSVDKSAIQSRILSPIQAKKLFETESISAESVHHFKPEPNANANLWSRIKSAASLVFDHIKNPLETFATGFIIKTPSDFDMDQLNDELLKLTGSRHLKMFFKTVSPLLVKSVKFDIPGFNPDEDSLERILNYLFTRAYLNIGKHLEDQTVDGKKPDVSDILNYLFNILNERIPDIHKAVRSIKEIGGKVESNPVLDALFNEISNKLVDVFFPRGEKEMPVLQIPHVSAYLWKYLKDDYLPSLIRILYLDLEKPLALNHEGVLKLRKGGETIVAWSDMLTETVTESVEALFKQADGSKDPAEVFLYAAAELMSSLKVKNPLRKWLEKWISLQFQLVERNLHPKFWKLLGSYVKPIFLHACVHLSAPSKREDEESDVLALIIRKVLLAFTAFFNSNGKEVQRLFESVKLDKSDPVEKRELIDLFDRLTTDMLKLCNLQEADFWPLPSFIKTISYTQAKALITKILIRQYFAFKETELDERQSINQLKVILNDERTVQKPLSEVSANKVGIAATSENPTISAATHVVAGICEKLSEQTLESLLDYFNIKAEAALDININKTMSKFFSYGLKWLNISFIDTATYLIQTSSVKSITANREHKYNAVTSDIILRFAKIINREFRPTHLDSKRRGSPKKNTKDLTGAMVKLVGAVADSAGDTNPFSLLPIHVIPGHDNLRNNAWKLLKKNIFPDLLSNLYTNTMPWRMQIEESNEALQKIYTTTHPKQAMKVVSKFASAYVKNYLKTSPTEVSELLYTVLQAWLEKESIAPSATKTQSGANVLKTFKPQILEMIKTNLTVLGDSDEQLNWVWISLTDYFQGMITKIFLSLSISIHEIEKQTENLEVEIAIDLVKAAVEYLRILNGVNPDISKLDEASINLNESFSSRLHPAVADTPSATPKEKAELRLREFFLPLAEKFLKLSDIKGVDYPFPEGLKDTVDRFLKEKLLPEILMNAFKKLLDPEFKNAMMLSFVEQLDKTLNQIEPKSNEKATVESQKNQTDFQRNLNKQCGNVVLELVDLIPDTNWIQYPLMRDKIKQLSEGAIGKAMMDYLSRWTFLQMIDSAIYYGLPSIHTGKWEGKDRMQKFIPQKAYASTTEEKMELREEKNFEFEFETVEDQNKPNAVMKRSEAEKTHENLRKEFTRTISTQLEAKAWAFIKLLWQQIQERLDDIIERYFPDKGPAFKAKLDEIFRRVFLEFIGPALAFILKPFIKSLKLIIDRVYINKRADEIIYSMQKESLEHLLYKWTDIFMDALLKNQQPKTTY